MGDRSEQLHAGRFLCAAVEQQHTSDRTVRDSESARHDRNSGTHVWLSHVRIPAAAVSLPQQQHEKKCRQIRGRSHAAQVGRKPAECPLVSAMDWTTRRVSLLSPMRAVLQQAGEHFIRCRSSAHEKQKVDDIEMEPASFSRQWSQHFSRARRIRWRRQCPFSRTPTASQPCHGGNLGWDCHCSWY